MIPSAEMYIISLELVGYNRMRLNDVKGFTFKPKDRLQLILGTNGCGKSSMLAELWPMPPKPSDFDDGGFKRIVVAKNGHTYCLTSTKTGSSMRHSFVKDDGEELNPGGTGMVQKELVWQEFGLTQDIIDLISGKEDFTTMSPARRREWFTKLSEVSYDFAIAVFNKLKERLRDTSGAIKIQKKYLVEETRKLVSEKELTELKLRQSELQELLNKLFSISKPNNGTSVPANALQQSLGELDQLNKKLSPIMRALESGEQGIKLDRQTTDDAIVYHQAQYSKYTALVESHSRELEDLTKKYDLLMQRGQETLQSLGIQHDEITVRKQYLENAFRTSIRQYLSGSAAAAQANFAQVKDELVEVLNQLPLNTEGTYGKPVMIRLESQLEGVRSEIQHRNNRASVLRNYIEQAKCQHRDGTVVCPSCEHSWSLSDASNTIAQYEKELQDIVNDDIMSQLDKKVAALSEDIEANRIYADLFIRLFQAGRTLNQQYFGDAWQALFPIDEIRSAPKRLAIQVSDIEHDLNLAVEDEVLSDRLKEIDRLVAISRDTEAYNADELKERIDKLHNLIFEYNGYVLVSNKTVQDLRAHLARLGMIERGAVQYDQLLQECYQSSAELVLAKLNAAVWQKINDTQIALSMVTEKVTNAHMQQGIIDDITRKIEGLEQDKKLLELMVSHMSPTEGLIADGLMGFINAYIRQMNTMIRKIWAYPLVIKTEMKDDIDYKFPMMIQSKTRKPVDDVSEGSAGMQEVVNLAYRITAMKYLGLGGYPLALDEFAKTMDEAHKSNATDMIKSLLDQEGFSQLFMVSHDPHQYGALSNPQVCVICPKNITLPSDVVVNEHVTFA